MPPGSWTYPGFSDDVTAAIISALLQERDDAIDDIIDGSETLTSPDINSFTNAQHDHTDAANGGQIPLSAISQSSASSGQVPSWNGSNWVAVTPATAVATTKGDLISHDGSGADRLPVGADGHPLVADAAQSLGLKWGGMLPIGALAVGCNAYRASNLSVSHNTLTTIGFDSEDFDFSTPFHDTSTNNDRMTIPTGWSARYLVYFHIPVYGTSNVGHNLDVFLRKNGSTIKNFGSSLYIQSATDPGGTNRWQNVMGVIELDLSAGDYIDLRIHQYSNDTTAMTILGGATGAYFGIKAVGTS